MKTILILMDSLNRHMVNVYNNNTWVTTPNISRLANKSIVFDNHWLGSAPCMPARRDIFTGRLNFLERHWGPIEPFDITLQEQLKANKIFTHIITDHHHYFELGGEIYCHLFNSWDFHRGQEYDPWISRVIRPMAAKKQKHYGVISPQYELNRLKFINEEDFPVAKTFRAACEWLESNKDADDFFLVVESFSPHEPFDCPREYLDMYDDDYNGPRYEWSSYAPVNEPPEAIEHLRKQYAGILTMADRWLGKLLDTLDDNQLWDDTLLIFTTDHGHLLGEHGWTGKNRMHVYNELAHIPFMIHLPGGRRAGERIGALTQNIDVMPTILDYYGIDIPNCVHGYSLKGILEGTENKVRNTALYGWFGKTVNITDGKYTYFRAPVRADNFPCYAYCAMPITLKSFMGRDCIEDIHMGRYLKHTNYPVYKIPVKRPLGGLEYANDTLLFDIENDYNQQQPIINEQIEKEMIQKLVDAMERADAPDDQYRRLGLEKYVI